MTIEQHVLGLLDVEEGTEAHTVMSFSRRQTSAALQRLHRKGLAEPVRCPDGAWVWFRINAIGCRA